MIADYCIVYVYFNTYGLNREVVLQNYYSHVVANPGIPVIPVSVGNVDWVPETVLVDDWLQWRSQHSKLIFFPDYLFFAYLRSPHRVEASRYVLVDWDTFSFGVSFPEFLSRVWDADVGGGRLSSCCESAGSFWCGKWCGCSPIEVLYYDPDCVFCFSQQAALKLSRVDPDCFCSGFQHSYLSVRIPTLARFLKFDVRGDPYLGDTLSYREIYNFPSVPSIYHPVRMPFSLTDVALKG